MRLAPIAVLAAALAAGLSLAPRALAEEIVLVSGARYDARDVAVLESGLRFTVVVDGGRATIVLPFERIDGENLIGLLSARLDSRLGATHLRLARVALERGLTGVAEARFRRAAEVDPALAPERDAGLAAVRDALTQRMLDAAVKLMKQGRNDLAFEQAKAAIFRAEAGSPLAQRAQEIAELAGKTAERDRIHAQEQAEALAKAKADATAAAYQDAFHRARAQFDAAVAERGKAADPNAGPTVVRHALEVAEVALRDARRWLAAALDRDPSHAADVERADREALPLLVATHVDLAEAYRLDGMYDKARDRVRAALVLDPNNARAASTLDRIEADVRQPAPEPLPYYGPYSPGYGVGIGLGYVGGATYVRSYGVVGSMWPVHTPYGVGGGYRFVVPWR